MLEYNPVSRRQEWFVIDEMTGQSGIETVEDYTSIIEGNKAEYAMTDERARFDSVRGKEGMMHRVAHIPLSIAHDLWKKSSRGKDQKVLRRFLTDPDNRFFLTRPLKL
jgi:hypothetical protein